MQVRHVTGLALFNHPARVTKSKTGLRVNVAKTWSTWVEMNSPLSFAVKVCLCSASGHQMPSCKRWLPSTSTTSTPCSHQSASIMCRLADSHNALVAQFVAKEATSNWRCLCVSTAPTPSVALRRAFMSKDSKTCWFVCRVAARLYLGTTSWGSSRKVEVSVCIAPTVQMRLPSSKMNPRA